MDNKEILDTLKAAKLYLNSLKHLDTEIEGALKQITNTYKETEKNIIETFANLKNSLVQILSRRENYLIDQAKRIRNEGLSPLEECRSLILSKVDNTNRLINVGNSVIEGYSTNLDEFTNSASLLGSLPEVPDLKEVPFIRFHCEPSTEIDLKEILASAGNVTRIAPIQITELTEKPGAILIGWQTVENDDRIADIQEFRLQKAFGDVCNNQRLLVNFSDCYRGLDTQFLVKDLRVDQNYSFRVCCKFEGADQWSPWSVPQVSRTRLAPFCWRPSRDFATSDENRIAAPLGSSVKILTSDGPQFGIGHSIEFTFLEVGSNNAIIGLLSSDLIEILDDLNAAKANSFLINRNGGIFVDGVEKSTKLPEFSKGLKVFFTCESVNSQKVRVNIDSSDKRVTYDWPVGADSKLYFVAQFFSCDWKIMVE